MTGHRYLGGFVGCADSEKQFITKKVNDWIDAVSKLAKIANDFPQAAYSGMQRSLQQDW